MGKLIIILIGLLFFAVFAFACYFYTNGYSLPKKYRIVSNYYEDGKEIHIVQWKAFFHWHDYLLDGCYMDHATFGTIDEAYEWVDNIEQKQ